MAITNVNIVQDNITGGVDLLNIASPLIFLVDATYTIAPPDNLYAKVYDKDSVLLGTYRSMPWRDTSSTNRRFSFEASEILRQFLLPLDDWTQSGNTLQLVSGMTMHFKIVFSNLKLETGVTDEIEFEAINAASQFGEYTANIQVGTNLPQGQAGVAGQWAYAYFYDNVGVGTITATQVQDIPYSNQLDSLTGITKSLNDTYIEIAIVSGKLRITLHPYVGLMSPTVKIPIIGSLTPIAVVTAITDINGTFVPSTDLSMSLGVFVSGGSGYLTPITPVIGVNTNVDPFVLNPDSVAVGISFNANNLAADVSIDLEYVLLDSGLPLIPTCNG